MILEVTATESAFLSIPGTELTLPSVYCRLEIYFAANGINIQVGNCIWASEAMYNSGDSMIKIDELSETLYNFEVDVAGGETPSIALATNKMQAELQALGYTVTKL